MLCEKSWPKKDGNENEDKEEEESQEEKKKEEQNRTQFGPPADIDCYYVLLLLSAHMMKIADKQPTRGREQERKRRNLRSQILFRRASISQNYTVICNIVANGCSGYNLIWFGLVCSFSILRSVSKQNVAAALFTLHLTVKTNSFR